MSTRNLGVFGCCLVVTHLPLWLGLHLRYCRNVAHALCTSSLRSANALFAALCCGLLMPKNTFLSDRSKFLLISEGIAITGGLK